MALTQRKTASDSEILTRATIRAADLLQLSQSRMSQVLGISASSYSRSAHGDRLIEHGTKEGELALLFLRVFRSLDTLVGGDEEKAARWLHGHNRHLDGVPAQLITSIGGLVRVGEYLDAMRGKV